MPTGPDISLTQGSSSSSKQRFRVPGDACPSLFAPQGGGEENRSSSSSGSDSEKVTTPIVPCWGMAGPRDLHLQTPVRVLVVGAIE